jgi:hypothetical protein
MFILDVSLKNTPLALSVQKKTAEDAEAAYQSVLAALNASGPQVIELTCEHQPGKKLSILSSEISAVQVYEKSSTATSSGRPPGFFALTE